MKRDTVQVDFGGEKIYKLHFQEFETNIDMDSLTQIDYNNIYAELITISSLLNRVGIWKAQAEHAHADAKLDTSIYEAKQSEFFRNSLKRVDKEKIKWPTKDEVANAVTLDKESQIRRKRVIRLAKEAAYIDAIYWAVKDKAKKIDKISERMQLKPEDFSRELIEESINGIMIKAYKKKYNTSKP